MTSDIDRLRAEIGVVHHSDWIVVDQAMIDRFADATLDRQFIHVDPARAKAETPFGGTIAHGLLSLSLLPHLHSLIPELSAPSMKAALNYGFDRVRFVSPVRSGSRIRMAATISCFDELRPGSFQQTLDATIEVESEAKPALAASWIIRFEF